MEILLTVLSGVLIFVLGQILQTFILKPLYDFKIVLGEISHKVKYHSNIITSSGIKSEAVGWSSKDMRDLSCQLESRYLAIPFNDIFGVIGTIPKRNYIREAAKNLVLLSNTAGSRGFEKGNSETINQLKKCLGLTL